ncbi:MAG: oxidoreductase [Acidimicrobiales bacterium]
MKLLPLSGTGWLGSTISRCALAMGLEVTALARGETGHLVPGVRFVAADRNGPDPYRETRLESWDVIVEVASHPRWVRQAIAAHGGLAARWCYVSSVSVYRDPSRLDQDERAEVATPFHGEMLESFDDYAGAKVGCEALVRSMVGENDSLIIRPGLIGGAGDLSDRTGYWPWRFAHAAALGREVLIPDPIGREVQIVDVEDLAGWIVSALDFALSGTYNVVGDTISLADYFSICRSLNGGSVSQVIVSSEWLVEQGVASWAGHRSLPLWIAESGHEGFARWSGAKARDHGFHARPMSETMEAVLLWELSRDASERRAGLTDLEEQDLLMALSKGSR